MAEAVSNPGRKAEDKDEVKGRDVDPAVKEGVATGEGLVITEHALEVVQGSRDLLKEEAKDIDGTNGPADNLTGDASESADDHIHSNDPYKKSFPPGPADPTKAAKVLS